jgi:hypothetical protein
MKKLGFLAMVSAIAGILVASSFSGDATAAGGDCKHPKLETTLVKTACAAGGQKAAKDAMKKWMKTAKKTQADLDCGSCHAKLAPAYPLKPDGMKQFKALGGT